MCIRMSPKMGFKLVISLCLLAVWHTRCEARDIILGTNCKTDPCFANYTLDCSSISDSSSLLSPDYSSQNSSSNEYQLVLEICPQKSFQLTLNTTLFSLQPNESITFGTGKNVGLNVLFSLQGDELHANEEVYIYDTHSNQIWFTFLLPSHSEFLLLVDTVQRSYVNNMGNISSENYPNPYPANTEALYLINISASYNYDIKFTVYDLDLNGFGDDYLAIGPGLDPTGTPNALLSWASNTFSFVVEGNQAYIYFKSYKESTSTGFYIGYELMEQNVTTTPMPTTTTTGRPTAKPIDPAQLSVELIALDKPYDTWVQTGQMYNLQAAIAEICDCYANTTNIPLDYPLRPEDVIYYGAAKCYGGWAVDSKKCLYSSIMVVAFTPTGDYAFPKDVLSAAIEDDACRDPVEDNVGFRIVLVKRLSNIYVIASWISLFVALICAIGFLLVWRTKYRFYWKDQRRIYDAKLAMQAAEGRPRHSSSDSSWGGRSNPVFQLDDEEEEGSEQKNYLEYDPEFGTTYNTSNFGYQLPKINMYGRNSIESDTTSQFENPDTEDTLYDRRVPALFIPRPNMSLPSLEPKHSVASSSGDRHIYDFPEDLIKQAEEHFGETHF